MYKSLKYKCTDIDNDTNDYTASTNNASQNNTNNTKEKITTEIARVSESVKT